MSALALLPLLLVAAVLAATAYTRLLGFVLVIGIGVVAVFVAYVILHMIAWLWERRPRSSPLYLMSVTGVVAVVYVLLTSTRGLVPLQIPLVGSGVPVAINAYTAVVTPRSGAPDTFNVKEQVTVESSTGVQNLQQQREVPSNSSGFALRALTFRPWSVDADGYVRVNVMHVGRVRIKLCPVTCPSATIAVQGVSRDAFYAAGTNSVAVSGPRQLWNPPDIDQGVTFQYIPSSYLGYRDVIYRFVGISSFGGLLAMLATAIYSFLTTSLLIPIWLGVKTQMLTAAQARALSAWSHLHRAHSEASQQRQPGITIKEDSTNQSRRDEPVLRNSLHDAAELSHGLAALVWPLVVLGVAIIFRREIAARPHRRESSKARMQ